MASIQVETKKKSTVQSFLKRGIVYCIGLFIMALGVTFSVKSNLGVSPVSSLPYVFSLILKRDLGLVTTAVFSVYVLLQIIILRKDFKIYNLLQIVCASIFGGFISLSNNIFAFLEVPTTYVGRVVFLFISILFVALGLLLYLTPDIVPQPGEGLIGTISKKTNKEFPKIKMIFDCTSVMLSIIVAYMFLGKLQGIREGTIISAFAIGKVLGILSKRYKASVVKLCFGENTDTLV